MNLSSTIGDLKSILKFGFIEVQIGLQPGPLICFYTHWFYPEYEDLSSRSTKKKDQYVISGKLKGFCYFSNFGLWF